MDAMTFAAQRLAEQRFADLELENRRRIQRAERRAADAPRQVDAAPATRSPEPACAPAGLALAGPSS